MKNTTNIKVPKKYQPMIEVVEKDSDGYWAYTEKGYYFSHMGCHTAHEDSQFALIMVIRTVEKCDCSICEEEK